MDKCLSDKALSALYTGDGGEADHRHLETCLNCVRRYRRIARDVETIVGALRQSAGREAGSHRRTHHARWRWGLAAAAVLVAFAIGRFTSFTPARSDSSPQIAAEMLSNDDAPVMEASAGSQLTTANFALYMEDLLTPDDPGPDLTLASDSGSD